MDRQADADPTTILLPCRRSDRHSGPACLWAVTETTTPCHCLQRLQMHGVAESEAARPTSGETGADAEAAERFIEQLKIRSKADFDTLVDAFGSISAQWPFWTQWTNGENWEEHFRYVALAVREGGTDNPEFLLVQFKNNHKDEFKILVDYFNGPDGLVEDIQQRVLFHSPSEVMNQLCELAKQWRWSDDGERFVEQFRARYPEELEMLPMDLEVLKTQIDQATLPPDLIARKLLTLTRKRGPKNLEDPRWYWEEQPSDKDVTLITITPDKRQRKK